MTKHHIQSSLESLPQLNPHSQKAFKMARQEQFSEVSPFTTIRQDSGLLRLAPETRNAIYELVFSDLIVEVPKDRNGAYVQSTPSGLLMACKKLHAEATQFFYATATFQFRHDPLYRLEKWTRQVGPARTALVKKIHFGRDCKAHKNNNNPDYRLQANARSAQDVLENVQKRLGLSQGVLRFQVYVGYTSVWTASPIKFAEAIRYLTIYEDDLGRFWIDKPSDKWRRILPAPSAYTL